MTIVEVASEIKETVLESSPTMSSSSAGSPREQPGTCLDLAVHYYQQSQDQVQTKIPISPSVVSLSPQDLIPTNEDDDLRGGLDNVNSDHESEGYSTRGIDNKSAQMIDIISPNYIYSKRLLLDCDLSLDLLFSIVEALEDGDSLEKQLLRLKLILEFLKINIKSLSESREEHTHKVLGHIVRKRKRGSNDYKM